MSSYTIAIFSNVVTHFFFFLFSRVLCVESRFQNIYFDLFMGVYTHIFISTHAYSSFHRAKWNRARHFATLSLSLVALTWPFRAQFVLRKEITPQQISYLLMGITLKIIPMKSSHFQLTTQNKCATKFRWTLVTKQHTICCLNPLVVSNSRIETDYKRPNKSELMELAVIITDMNNIPDRCSVWVI